MTPSTTVPGTVWGSYTILRYSDETYRTKAKGKSVVRNKLVVGCNKCGAVHTLRIDSVHMSKHMGYAGCPTCRNPAMSAGKSQKHHRVAHDPTRWCPECFGQSWRRPLTGNCRCGEAHEPEQFGPAEMYRGQCAIVGCELS